MAKNWYDVLADDFDRIGDRVTGLDLAEIGEDGHQVANLMWKISALMKKRSNDFRENKARNA